MKYLVGDYNQAHIYMQENKLARKDCYVVDCVRKLLCVYPNREDVILMPRWHMLPEAGEMHERIKSLRFTKNQLKEL